MSSGRRRLEQSLLHAKVRELLAPKLHDLSGQDTESAPLEEGPGGDAGLREESRKAPAASGGLEARQQRGGNAAAFVCRMYIHSVEVSRGFQIGKTNDRLVHHGDPDETIVPDRPGTTVIHGRPGCGLCGTIVPDRAFSNRPHKDVDDRIPIRGPVSSDENRCHGAATPLTSNVSLDAIRTSVEAVSSPVPALGGQLGILATIRENCATPPR